MPLDANIINICIAELLTLNSSSFANGTSDGDGAIAATMNVTREKEVLPLPDSCASLASFQFPEVRTDIFNDVF